MQLGLGVLCCWTRTGKVTRYKIDVVSGRWRASQGGEKLERAMSQAGAKRCSG